MTGKEILVSLIPLLAPVLTGSMGALGILIKDRRNEKNFDLRLRRQVEIGQAQVQFIQAWIQARQLLGPLEDDLRPARDWLDRCYAAVEASRKKVEPPKKAPVLRRLLLIRPLHGVAAQVWRVFYWLTFIWCNVYVVMAIWGVADMIKGVPDSGYLIIGSVFYAAILAACAAGMRAASAHCDREAQKPVSKPPLSAHGNEGRTPHTSDRSAATPHWSPRTPSDKPEQGA